MLGLGHGIQINNPLIAGVAIEDYMWELDGAGSLKPLASGTVSDFHDTWDLITISTAGHYQPQTIATVSDEGYWDIGSPADVTDTDYIRPLDV